MTPKRYRLSRKRGFRLPADVVNVARPSRLGNPYFWQELGRETAVSLFEIAIEEAFGVRGGTLDPVYIERVLSLRGKSLACWCPLPKRGEPDICHAAVLLRFANERPGLGAASNVRTRKSG